MAKIVIKKSFDSNGVNAKVRAGIELYGATASKKLEGNAKQYADWQDRTGNARNSIQGNFNWKGKKATIELSGNVDYFVYLELAHEKKYAVLIPTIQKDGPEVLEGYREIFK